ncbi:unnamed protein product [Prunus brigantina]
MQLFGMVGIGKRGCLCCGSSAAEMEGLRNTVENN